MRFLVFALAAVLVLAGFVPAGPAWADDYLWCWDQDEIYAVVGGSSVTIHHDATVYNCCPDPFQYEAFWEEDRLVMVEQEVLTNPCYCLCCYDLSFTVDNVPPGQWPLLFRWYDQETSGWRQVELTIPVADEGQSGEIMSAAAWQSDCLSVTAVPDDPEPEFRNWGALKALYR